MGRTPWFLSPDLPALVVGAKLRMLLDHEAEILGSEEFDAALRLAPSGLRTPAHLAAFLRGLPGKENSK